MTRSQRMESTLTEPTFLTTRYTFGEFGEHTAIEVELTCLAGKGPHKPERDTWAIRQLGFCLTHDGDWEYEPLPSSRDDEFLARCRWDLPLALERAHEVAQTGGRFG